MDDKEKPMSMKILEASGKFVSLGDYIGSPVKVPSRAPELIEGRLRQGHTLMAVAPPKAGKSWTLESLALAAATGGRWMGHQIVGGRHRVLFIDTEIDQRSLFNRFESIRRAMGIGEDVGDVRLMSLRGTPEDIETAKSDIFAYYGDNPPDMMVIDSMYSFESGDENSVGDMKPLMDNIKEISTWGGRFGSSECLRNPDGPFGPSIVYSHHTAKGGGGGRSAVDRGAGSSIFGRAPDAILTLIPLVVPEGSDEEGIIEDFARTISHERTAAIGQDIVLKPGQLNPMRASWVLREFPDPGTSELVFAWPLMEHIEGLDGLFEEGSDGAARAKMAGGFASSSEKQHLMNDGQIALGVSLCIRDGVDPTPENVYARIDSKLRPKSPRTFKNWFTPANKCTRWIRDRKTGFVALPVPETLG